MNPFPTEDTALDEEIARVYSQLTQFNAETDEYRNAAARLTELYKLRHDQFKLNLEARKSATEHELEQQKMDHQYDQDNRPWFQRVDPNTALAVAGNIAIGLAVIKYEQTGVISSKVWSFMKKI